MGSSSSPPDKAFSENDDKLEFISDGLRPDLNVNSSRNYNFQNSLTVNHFIDYNKESSSVATTTFEYSKESSNSSADSCSSNSELNTNTIREIFEGNQNGKNENILSRNAYLQNKINESPLNNLLVDSVASTENEQAASNQTDRFGFILNLENDFESSSSKKNSFKNYHKKEATRAMKWIRMIEELEKNNISPSLWVLKSKKVSLNFFYR